MKKYLIVATLVGLAFYLKTFNENNEKEQEIAPSLVSKTVTKKIHDRQEEILKQVLPKKTIDHKSFKPFLAKQAGTDTQTKIEQEFLKSTFQTLMKCYEQGCGEKPDHDGYYNEAQTAAMLSLNQVLKETLDKGQEASSQWLSENELLELFNSPNSNTRDLSFKHMMNRGNKQEQITKIIENTANLDGYNYSETISSVMDHIDESNKDQFIDSVVTSFKKKNANARVEALFAFVDKKFQFNDDQWSSLATSLCDGLKDINNKEAYRNLTNEAAVQSGLSITIEEACQE